MGIVVKFINGEEKERPAPAKGFFAVGFFAIGLFFPYPVQKRAVI